MIPGDYCRCLGEDCDKAPECERHAALHYGPDIISLANRLCNGKPTFFIPLHEKTEEPPQEPI